ncbi:RING-type E3 ubiquitin-protein ligase PPIL2 [Parasteatoda tepidariorum]|uniref:RING-type E3 ubiquitin-protein ligase PPIL2 n=1 Tax=Parasteatoda tepidariorum TaxID=114398 RepID=UPI00077FBE5C|nr:RING-type E3 ubiquitin-protein ligase PPIL2 [Parasteatoda tepidariorum]
MGKKQHQKDKMYLTATEWSQFYGGKKQTANTAGAEFRRLPFDHCALSLQPFEHPLCTPEGVVYDLMHIIPFLKKYHIDPATGKPLDSKTLIKLNFTKNSDGFYHCPVLFKVFNENSHIVAIKTTGNVFSYEAIDQLNLKTKNFKDLITDVPFTRNDIITIQDPSNLEKFNFNNFHHVKNKLSVSEENGEKDADSYHNLKSVNSVTRDVLEELKRESANKASEKKTEEKVKADKYNAAHYSTGAVAASSTSTAVEPSTFHEAAVLDDNTVRYARVKKKGYAQMITNLGPLNLELHCEIAPKACDNFIKLCKTGYYDNTIFHRSIKNFMIQGGDPTGTGNGGESIWKKTFKDEFAPHLSHQGRGILSMANSGPNTNKSQFFITYRSCQHLDKKHTIFGKVVGGLDTLNRMEKILTDKEDKPVEKIEILKVQIFVDPFQEIDDLLARLREEEKKESEKSIIAKKEPSTKKLKVYHQGVGKYIDASQVLNTKNDSVSDVKKKKNVSGKFDFSKW